MELLLAVDQFARQFVYFFALTPPFAAVRRNTSSGTLRGCLHNSHADECEKITGALLKVRRKSQPGQQLVFTDRYSLKRAERRSVMGTMFLENSITVILAEYPSIAAAFDVFKIDPLRRQSGAGD